MTKSASILRSPAELLAEAQSLHAALSAIDDSALLAEAVSLVESEAGQNLLGGVEAISKALKDGGRMKGALNNLAQSMRAVSALAMQDRLSAELEARRVEKKD